MATFEDLKLQIKLLPEFAGLQSIGDFLLSQAVNDGMRHFQQDLQSRFEQVTGAPITLTSGTQDYTLPSDYKEMQDVFFRKAGATNKTHLIRRSKEWFDLHYPDPATTGTPSDWMLWGGSIRIGPTPAVTGDVIVLDYEGYKATLTDGAPGNSNDLTIQFPQAIRWAGAAELTVYAAVPVERLASLRGLYQEALVRARRVVVAETMSATALLMQTPG